MNMTQAQIDDLLELLMALTRVPDVALQRDRLARLCLLLAQHIDDAEVVRAQVVAAMAAESQRLTLSIP